ncbi:hypothetical protein ACEZDB_38250 [Streptacidiphilus sp. N1-3]|uniref:LPXTG-motif cell wall anchor domain-containing protein n=1 Tax=Streptacidiphilus alkalitolerans TaxID=3342712 RepID=A0ABV6XE28_9ACTN
MPLSHRRTRYSYLLGVLTGILGLAALVGTALGATGGTPAAAPPEPNADCTLTVPANPLSAQGLATPYLLSATDRRQGPCHEADTAQSAFVQATVLDPATGALSVYDPLVIDKGSRPAAPPVRPKLPRHAVVGIWFGFNAGNLTLRGTGGSLSDGHCVNGLGRSLFSQFAYCNAPAFFRAANAAEHSGKLVVPPLGSGKDGRACMSTRDFGLIDQDQSDNVTTDYLATADGRTAQKNAANTAALAGASPLLNGSDNLLLIAFVDPALGCTPFTAPDLADPGQRVTSLGLDEIQAARFQTAPIALVPVNDPMVQVDGRTSRAKTNLYRAGVDMPPLSGTDTGDPLAYCTSLETTGAQRINDDRRFFAPAVSPDNGTSLFDFLTARLAASLTNLGCAQPGGPSTSSASPSAPGTPSATATPTATATASASATAPASAPVSATATPQLTATMIGVPATSPAASATASPSPTTFATAVAAGFVGTAAMVSPSVAPLRAVPAGSILPDTGAAGSPMPYLGLAVSLILLGLSAFILVGRREPARRPR